MGVSLTTIRERMLEAAGTRNCGSAFWGKNFKLKLLLQLGLVEVRIRIYRLRLFCVRICAENFAIPNEIVSSIAFPGSITIFI